MVEVATNPLHGGKLTMSCSACHMHFRIQRIGPHVRVGAPSFCPQCGSHAGCSQDMDRDYWETLAGHYRVPVDVIKEVYDLWDPRTHTNFSDFMRELEAEAEATTAHA
jgi:NAD-dependent SIR2 family protein deacetylase